MAGVDVNKIPSALCLCIFRPADLAWRREMGQVPHCEVALRPMNDAIGYRSCAAAHLRLLNGDDTTVRDELKTSRYWLNYKIMHADFLQKSARSRLRPRPDTANVFVQARIQGRLLKLFELSDYITVSNFYGSYE